MLYTLLVFVLRRKGEIEGQAQKKGDEMQPSLHFFCCPPPKIKQKSTKKGFDFSIHSYIVTFAAAYKLCILYNASYSLQLWKKKREASLKIF